MEQLPSADLQLPQLPALPRGPTAGWGFHSLPRASAGAGAPAAGAATGLAGCSPCPWQRLRAVTHREPPSRAFHRAPALLREQQPPACECWTAALDDCFLCVSCIVTTLPTLTPRAGGPRRQLWGDCGNRFHTGASGRLTGKGDGIAVGGQRRGCVCICVSPRACLCTRVCSVP